MSQIITEGTPPLQLQFSFPDTWDICKFDDTSFYRNRVEKLNGVKSVDILAKSNTVLHFIEIKDFSKNTYRLYTIKFFHTISVKTSIIKFTNIPIIWKTELKLYR